PGPRGRPRARPQRRRRPPPRTPPPPGTPRPWRTPRPWTTPPRLRPRTPPLRLRLRTRPRRQLPTLRTRRGRTPGTAPKTTASSGGEPSRPAAGPETTRVKIAVGYDGSGFSGWARQPGRRTVQQTLEDALCRVLRLPEAAPLTVAGRTDAGVHARGQVVHVDLPAPCWAAAQDTAQRRLCGIL